MSAVVGVALLGFAIIAVGFLGWAASRSQREMADVYRATAEAIAAQRDDAGALCRRMQELEDELGRRLTAAEELLAQASELPGPDYRTTEVRPVRRPSNRLPAHGDKGGHVTSVMPRMSPPANYTTEEIALSWKLSYLLHGDDPWQRPLGSVISIIKGSRIRSARQGFSKEAETDSAFGVGLDGVSTWQRKVMDQVVSFWVHDDVSARANQAEAATH